MLDTYLILPPTYNYEIQFLSSFFIPNETINSFIKLLKTRDSKLSENKDRGNSNKVRIIYLRTGMCTSDLYILKEYFEDKYDYLKITISKKK